MGIVTHACQADSEAMKRAFVEPGVMGYETWCKPTMREIQAQAEIEAQVKPTSLDVSWGREQIAVSYDGSTSILPLDEDCYVTDSTHWYIAENHSKEVCEVGIAAFEAHAQIHNIEEGI